MVANALSQLIRDSSQVLVMGHKNSDMDAIGAAAGMVCAARVKGRPVHIVVDRQHTMASDLIERLETQSEYKGVFISAEDAMIACDFNTLLIVVDVNRPGYVESAASGLLCGLSLGRDLRGLGTAELPGITAMGAMGRYVSTPNRDFQPMNCTFGLLDGLLVDKQHKKIRNKQERYTVISERSLSYLRDWVTEMQV